MKKQYHVSESYMFKRTITVYRDGKLTLSETLWTDEADGFIEQLEEDGYVCGYTQKEVDEAKRIYEERLANLIAE